MDGCALYRQFIPHLNIPGSRFVFLPPDKGGVPFRAFAEAEVAVVQRQVTTANYDAIQQLRNYGIKVIYDTDDDLWSLPSANPGKQIFKNNQEGFNRCALACDLITVSTRGLKTAVTTAIPRFSGEILICPNAVDFRLFGPPTVERDPDRIVLGWAGSDTHGEDVREVWHVLPELVEEFPQLHLEFIGMAPPPRLYGHPRVKQRRFVPVGEFPSRFSTWAWDLTVAPLADNRFNRSKSNIKMLEAAALGIPCLVSWVRPYEEFCALGGLNWLLCNNETQWRTKLRELIGDAALRKDIAGRMYRTTKTWFNAEQTKDNWIHAARTALAK